MLEGAKRDLNQAEANLSAVGWRNAALAKVNEAEALIKKAARDDWRDDFGQNPQPHYLQAVSDLRFAKAWHHRCPCRLPSHSLETDRSSWPHSRASRFRARRARR